MDKNALIPLTKGSNRLQGGHHFAVKYTIYTVIPFTIRVRVKTNLPSVKP